MSRPPFLESESLPWCLPVSLCPENPPISASCLPDLCLLLLHVPCLCPLGSVCVSLCWLVQASLLPSFTASSGASPGLLRAVRFWSQAHTFLFSFQDRRVCNLEKKWGGGCAGSRRACRQLLRPISSRLEHFQTHR